LTLLYLDTSALVKRYLNEPGSGEIRHIMRKYPTRGSLEIARIEGHSAFAKAARMDAISLEEAIQLARAFDRDWFRIFHLRVNDSIVELASRAAWDHGLRAYDAAHLGAALYWKEITDLPVLLATFDRDLHAAARDRGLLVFPESL